MDLETKIMGFRKVIYYCYTFNKIDHENEYASVCMLSRPYLCSKIFASDYVKFGIRAGLSAFLVFQIIFGGYAFISASATSPHVFSDDFLVDLTVQIVLVNVFFFYVWVILGALIIALLLPGHEERIKQSALFVTNFLISLFLTIVLSIMLIIVILAPQIAI